MSDNTTLSTPQIPNPEHPLANYQFSSEELRVLRECNSESFFQRSLPLGTTFGVTAFLGVRNGTLSANAKFGAAPKVVIGVIIGYFLGKISYQTKCAEKMMRLPNSRLGEILRQKNNGGGSFAANQAIGSASFGLPFATQQKPEMYDDSYLRNEKTSSLDIDMERPTSVGLDDQQRTNIDSQFDNELPLEPLKRQVSYDDLRKENREKYLKATSDIGSSTSLPLEAPNVIRSNKKSPPNSDFGGERSKFGDDNPPRSQKKNQYGDEWSS